MELYRGLRLNIEDIEHIRINGDCNLQQGSWLMKPIVGFHEKSVDLVVKHILNDNVLTERYIQNSPSINNYGKYVTGCLLGASIYSNDKPKKDKSVVLKLDVPKDKIFIDGRDFLYYSVPKIIQKGELSGAKTETYKLLFYQGW